MNLVWLANSNDAAVNVAPLVMGILASILSSRNPAAMLPGIVPSVIALARDETRAWLQPNSSISGAKNTPGVETVPPKIKAPMVNSTATITQTRRSCLGIKSLLGLSPAVKTSERLLNMPASPSSFRLSSLYPFLPELILCAQIDDLRKSSRNTRC